MVIVDTSIWISHLRKGSSHLKLLLLDGEVASHPFIVGELACGNMKNQREILSLLQALPMVPVFEQDEILYFIERNGLAGAGIGLIDVHLLASARLSKLPLWTSDKRLKKAAEKLTLAYN